MHGQFYFPDKTLWDSRLFATYQWVILIKKLIAILFMFALEY